MSSINDKIAQYSKINNIGSKPSSSQTSNAQKTAIGNIGGTIKASRQSSPSKPTVERMSATAVSGRAKGSLEGYMHAPSTYLAMNNTGYLSKANQKSRYSPKSAGVESFKSRNIQLGSSSKATNITDYRMTGKVKNSVCKLSDIMKVNKLF